MGEGAIETKADAHATQLKVPSKMNSRADAEGRKRHVGLEFIAVILQSKGTLMVTPKTDAPFDTHTPKPA